MVSDLAHINQRLQSGFETSPLFFDPKITNQIEIKRPNGYALPGFVAFSVTAEADGFTATGYGEGSRDIAIEKAISEAFERMALFKFCADNKKSDTSSGWAAHRSAEFAVRAAVFELIERDVALTAWENGGPFYIVPESIWPKALRLWQSEQRTSLEFSDLRIFLSSTDSGACISALLFNESGNFVVGHASAFELQDAITSATNECFRAAHSAIQFDSFAEVMALHAGDQEATPSPAAHSLAYAYKETMPEVVRILSATEEEVFSQWQNHQTTFTNLNLATLDTQIFQVGDRIVARVRTPKYREIFWGRSKDLTKRNQHPHFVG